ncbi:MAG: dihydroorotase family protein [Anaerolineae bacterium]|nr:dihydroorotase family protein [Candidatus Roseilinea sp.]MDW8450955.1 dihydroorotase family protein [Anaerolineae bacterium]
MASSLVIKGGTLVSSEGVRRGDILIEGERIVEVRDAFSSDQSPVTNYQLLDASGLLIFPGLIDVHVHLRQPGGEHKEDFYTGTCAALAGGVTTVFAMPNTSPAVVDETSFDHAMRLAEQNAVCDFSLFLGATTHNSKLKTQNSKLLECGLKIYMGSSTGDLLVEDFAAQYEHFERYPHDRVIAVHAEHEPAVRYFARRGLRRPPICAEIEVSRAVAMAAHCNRRLHVCHVSTRREVEIIADAKARGVPVTCEFTPHHLFLSRQVVQDGGMGEQGDKGRGRQGDKENVNSACGLPPSCFEMNPPLRDQADVDALWANLAVADCIATDHAPHTLEEKRSANPPMGVPGLETMLPLLLTAAHEGRLRLEDIARLCCEGPARIYNIAGKGKIAPGFDADLTLVDPSAEWFIGDKPLFTKCNWTPFAGWPVRGAVQRVFVRGRLAFDAGRIVVERGFGRPVRN